MARDSLATRLQESVGVFHALGPKSPAPAGQCALRRPASTAASRRPHQTTRLPGRRLEASVIGQDSGESWAPGAGAPKLGGGAQDPLPSWSRTGEDSSSGSFPLPAHGPATRNPHPVAGPPPAQSAPLPGSRLPSGLATPDPAGEVYPGLLPTPSLTIPRWSRLGPPSRDVSRQALPWRLPTVPQPVRSQPIGKDQRPAREGMKLRAQRAREIRCHPCPPPLLAISAGTCAQAGSLRPLSFRRCFARLRRQLGAREAQPRGRPPGSSSRRFEWLGPDTRPVDVEM
ncbi:uncharacterized protein C2orf78-like, partial [Ornithorhynchus anatinus]|uniref:uncharacterized protein C2orf78-like n=1 Tax=Ornithorhynchus anatinus TaxID=9258 RepID=UPI0019D49975